MNLIEVIQQEMGNDDEGSEKKTEQLKGDWNGYTEDQRRAVDNTLITLTGWGMETLLKKEKESGDGGG